MGMNVVGFVGFGSAKRTVFFFEIPLDEYQQHSLSRSVPLYLLGCIGILISWVAGA